MKLILSRVRMIAFLILADLVVAGLFFYLLFASNFAFTRIITPINKLERIGTQIHLFYEKHDRLPANSGELGLENEEYEFEMIDKNTINVQLSDSIIPYSLNYNVSESH